MTTATTKVYYVGVIERTIVYYEVEAENPRAAAENWQEGEFSDRDDEALDTEGPCSVREQQPDGTWRKVPPSQWEDAPAMLEALLLSQKALNSAPRFRVGDTDSYSIATVVDRAIAKATTA